VANVKEKSIKEKECRNLFGLAATAQIAVKV